MKYQWNEIVSENDFVLIPGDVSWATYLENAVEDFKFIDELKGIKLISKGNHDYWWETLNKLNDFLQNNGIKTVKFMHNISIDTGEYVVCSAKGYEEATEKKHKDRELIRLELSLKESQKFNKPVIAMLHYPPFGKDGSFFQPITDILTKYNVKVCVYGHLHGDGHKKAFDGYFNGVYYKLVSADYLMFKPEKII
jgi:predicted phosphohydrolase